MSLKFPILFLFTLCALLSHSALAVDKSPAATDPGKIITACVLTAAEAYQVPPAILAGIHIFDPGRPGEEYINSDGEVTLGLMKVKISEIKQLSEEWNLSEEETTSSIKNDPCTNAGFVSWKLSTFMHESSRLKDAIKAYGAYIGHEPNDYYSSIRTILEDKKLIKKQQATKPISKGISEKWLLLTYSGITLIKKPISHPNLASCLNDMRTKQYMNSHVRIQCLEWNSGALYQYGKLSRPSWLKGIPKSIQLGNVAPWVE